LTTSDLLARLRESAQLTESKLRDDVIEEILQLKAAAAFSQEAADRWQARAERAERGSRVMMTTLAVAATAVLVAAAIRNSRAGHTAFP
jgi:hypothetical protein